MKIILLFLSLPMILLVISEIDIFLKKRGRFGNKISYLFIEPSMCIMEVLIKSFIEVIYILLISLQRILKETF